MVNWVEYFGAQLETKDGIKSTEEALSGKTRVGIYFSAHWCPPCRGFTPVLAEFYEEVVNANSSDLAIVFVSSDSDEESFAEYYGSMPWYSVPYNERDLAQSLGTKYSVRGIPAFIVLDAADGSAVDTNGRSTVTGARGDISKALATWKTK